MTKIPPMTCIPHQIPDCRRCMSKHTPTEPGPADPSLGEYHGWVLREVLFDNGEPVGHREPVQHPVAWRTFDGEGGYDYRSYDHNEDYHQEYVKRNGTKYAHWVEPLYTAPPRAIERAHGA